MSFRHSNQLFWYKTPTWYWSKNRNRDIFTLFPIQSFPFLPRCFSHTFIHSSLSSFSWLHVCLVVQPSLTLYDHTDYSPTGSFVHGTFLGKNTRVGSHFLFQGIFWTQRSNSSLLCLLHCRRIPYPLSYQGSPHLADHAYSNTGDRDKESEQNWREREREQNDFKEA